MMGIDSGRALSLNPSLRSAPIDSLHAVVSYLLSKGVHHKDMGRIFGMCPGALTADVRRDLAPVFRFLAGQLGVPSTGFRRVVNKCPRLLVCSVPEQLQPALIFLRRLGFWDMEALAYQDPVLLASSVERTLLPKLEYLAGELGYGREEAAAMVVRCPALFTFSVENNFRPKLGYLVGEMGRSVEELREFPQYFAFSLEKRIKPRHRQMEDRRLRLSLPEMLRTTDQEFALLLHRAGDKGAIFPRLE
ncbi:unnamed protein product [Spirodela intermedia]|nr:unnamed protein product [Spirodela intermedia]CAA6669910.1 unnamed protein product [Spirodela intermedia]